MVHYQKKIILLGLLLSIRGTSSKWCWTCQCIFARWSLLGPELGCCSSRSFDIDIMIHHDTCVCVTRWMARCKQPESEDWLDADQWTCQSMPKWLVAAVSNRLWKSLDLSTLDPVWSYPQKGGFDRSKMQKAWTWHEQANKWCQCHRHQHVPKLYCKESSKVRVANYDNKSLPITMSFNWDTLQSDHYVLIS